LNAGAVVVIAQILVSLWLFMPPALDLDTAVNHHVSYKLCIVITPFHSKLHDLAGIGQIEDRA
jgi:hypothetical protein